MITKVIMKIVVHKAEYLNRKISPIYYLFGLLTLHKLMRPSNIIADFDSKNLNVKDF